MKASPPLLKHRLDKWLCAARLYKTRSLASEEIAKGHVFVNGQHPKASREVHLADRIELRQGVISKTIIVSGLSSVRGNALMASTLYAETPESITQRAIDADQRKLAAEPALSLVQGRPTKRSRRKLAAWNRWTATSDP